MKAVRTISRMDEIWNVGYQVRERVKKHDSQVRYPTPACVLSLFVATLLLLHSQ